MSDGARECRVATLAEFLGPLPLRAVPLPTPVEPDAILVEVECATVCGTDLHAWEGTFDPQLDLTAGHMLGHECVGLVTEFGPGLQVDSLGQPLQIGDRLIWTGEACGRCLECSELRHPGLCRNRRGFLADRTTEFPYLCGAFGEYAYIRPRAERIKVPDGVKSTWASAASCALRTVMHGFERLGALDVSQRVLVQGAGPLGLFATAVAKAVGARQVIVVGGPASRLEIATAWGADEVIALEVPASERADLVRGMTGGLGPDVLIEASGSAAAFAEGVELARPLARYVLLGSVDSATVPVAPGALNRKQLTIFGTWSATIAHYRQALEFLDANRGRIDFDLLFSQEYALDQVADALIAMKSGDQVKPVIRPSLR